VYVKQEAATGEAAIATLSDEIVRAGFDVIDGPDYSRAQDAGHGTRQGDQTWHTWLTVVANLRGRDKARAITELRDALRQAGFPTASPQPGDGFLAEDGTEVTTLPGTNQH
jgi:hypothetical protein